LYIRRGLWQKIVYSKKKEDLGNTKNVKVEDSGFYLFSFSVSFSFIFKILDLRLGDSVMLQTVTQCDTVTHIRHMLHRRFQNNNVI